MLPGSLPPFRREPGTEASTHPPPSSQTQKHNTHTLKHSHTHTYSHIHTCTHMHKCTHTHTCTCIHKYIVPAHTQHPLWHRLLKDYQDQGLLVEGPLNNLRKNEMHLPKPSKLYNKRNPVSSYLPLSLPLSLPSFSLPPLPHPPSYPSLPLPPAKPSKLYNKRNPVSFGG